MNLDKYSSNMITWTFSATLHAAVMTSVNPIIGMFYGTLFLGLGILDTRHKFLRTKSRKLLKDSLEQII